MAMNLYFKITRIPSSLLKLCRWAVSSKKNLHYCLMQSKVMPKINVNKLKVTFNQLLLLQITWQTVLSNITTPFSFQDWILLIHQSSLIQVITTFKNCSKKILVGLKKLPSYGRLPARCNAVAMVLSVVSRALCLLTPVKRAHCWVSLISRSPDKTVVSH